MDVKLTPKIKGEKFPLKLNITIENKEELIGLWHRLNVPTHKIDEQSEIYFRTKSMDFLDLWDKLERKIVQLYK